MFHRVVFFAVALLCPALVAVGSELKLDIAHPESDKFIYVAVYDSAENFRETMLRGLRVQATGTQTEFLISLPPGEYALLLFLDLDDDGEIKTNELFGFPTEPYSSVRPTTGMPEWEDTKFALGTESITMEVTLETPF